MLNPQVVGSLGDWVGGLATAAAVWLAYRQFSKTQRSLLDTEHRNEALRVTAWATWRPDAHPRESRDRTSGRLTGFLGRRVLPWPADPRFLRVSNRSNSAVFDWRVFVLPSRGWDTYVRCSARLGPLHPDEVRAVPLGTRIPDVIYRFMPAKDASDTPGPPRFVVLNFNDAWGNGWIRTNGDLQQIPRDSRFLPLLVHLRNPAMDWAGTLDEADWAAFREAVKSKDLPERLSDLCHDPDLPWLTYARIEAHHRGIQAMRLRRLGTSRYTYERRAIVRKVSRLKAYRKVRRFFQTASRSLLTEVLYIDGG